MRSIQKIIGRKKELSILKEAFKSPRAEFLAIYGRRRVGKTFLVKNFFDSQPCLFVYVSGMKNSPLKQQLKNFTKVLESVWFQGIAVPSNWLEAFETLTHLIENSDKKQKIVVFLDELPWLATPKSKMLEALDYYWNRYWSNNSKIKLIVCGSAASWMIKNIIYNKGGLYNRITRQFRLEPFSLKETKDFLSSNRVQLNYRHVLEIYMVTGGVPYYLTHLRQKLSAAQNIDAMAFQPQGILYQDFEILFASLFDDEHQYTDIIRVVAEHRYGIMQEELLKQCKHVTSGGRGIEKLKNLEAAGFLTSFLSDGRRKKGIYYRLIDEYSAFYLKWIEPLKKSSQKFSKISWSRLRESPSWKSWSGYCFETICFKHVDQIRNALNLDETAIAKTWKHKGKGLEQGAQIDLLFDRSDDSITICEIKYTDKPFAIDKPYFSILKNKIESYKIQTQTLKQIFLAMITTSGLKKTIYSEELETQVVKLNQLFE